MKARLNRTLQNPAREFLLIVGGPSNTFNGYYHIDAANALAPQAPPADTSPSEINGYIGSPPAQPPIVWTHDIYWANFLYTAVKLVELGIVAPERGDLITILLYVSAYENRLRVDWRASPYNLPYHANSAWTGGGHMYDPTLRPNDQGTGPRQEGTQTNPATGGQPWVYSATEDDINLEILMRQTRGVDATTGLPPYDGGFSWRAKSPVDYLDAIVTIPYRLAYPIKLGDYPPVLNAPPLDAVLVKVLFARSPADICTYVKTGTWTGDRYVHWLETVTDEDDADRRVLFSDFKIPATCTWAGWGHLPTGVTLPDWQSAPSVDRGRVKIKRLDYIGHSYKDAYLAYGWNNAKGELALALDTDILRRAAFDDCLSGNLFAPDALGFLWGCTLGARPDDGSVGFAAMLAQYMKSVRACIGRTTFQHILESDRLPEPDDPVNGGWTTFP